MNQARFTIFFCLFFVFQLITLSVEGEFEFVRHNFLLQFLVMPPFTKLKISSVIDVFLPQADLSPYLFKITFLSKDFNPVFE